MKDFMKSLVDAIIQIESGGNPNAVSPVGAQGLMQLMPATGKELFEKSELPGKYDPFDARQNRHLGTLYISELLDRYDQDIRLALVAYNWGMGHLDALLKKCTITNFEHIRHFLPKETQDYVDKVMKIFSKEFVS